MTANNLKILVVESNPEIRKRIMLVLGSGPQIALRPTAQDGIRSMALNPDVDMIFISDGLIGPEEGDNCFSLITACRELGGEDAIIVGLTQSPVIGEMMVSCGANRAVKKGDILKEVQAAAH